MLAVLLALVFLVSFILGMVLFRVNDTLLNPGFSIGQLRKADVYTFFYRDALPVLADEALKSTQSSVVDIKAAEGYTLSAAAKVFPPEWLQRQVELTIRQVLPYLTGDADEFSVTIPLADRVGAAGKVVKETLPESALLDSLYNYGVATVGDAAAEGLGGLPLGLNVTRDDLVSAFKTLAPKAWLSTQIQSAVDQVVPYLQGRSDQFRIVVPLAERAGAVGQVIKDLAHKSGAADFLFEAVLLPLVGQGMAPVTQLPYGIVVTGEEAEVVLRQVLPHEWAEARLDDVLDSLVGYLTGKTSALSVTISFADRRDAAYHAIAGLVDRKLEAALTALPVCTPQQLLTLAPPGPGQLPACRPPGTTYDQAKQLLGIDTSILVRQALGSQIRDALTFGEAELRGALGEDTWRQLQEVRTRFVQGLSYSDADLRRDLGKDNAQTLDMILQRTREGVTFTQEDLRDRLREQPGGPQAVDSLDQMRSSLGTARRWLWALWLWLGLLLAGIGALGARGLGGKVAWAGAVLGIAALLLLLATGPAYSLAARPQMQTALAEVAASGEPAMAPIVDKAVSIGQSVADDFVAGIRSRAVLFLIIAVVGMSGGVAWQVTSRKRTQPPPAGGGEKAGPEKP
ncbi:MAG: hypothetical protein HY686_02635 [Chloroflexi bacterium]|nr:hypothetical protein [Chloroflexota bacterium]